MIIENKNYKIAVENGIIKGIYHALAPENLASKFGNTAAACITLKSDDITAAPKEAFESYADRVALYDCAEQVSDTKIICKNNKYLISTEYEVTEKGLDIISKTDCDEISQFGITLDLNFMGQKESNFKHQLLPSSPYTSADGKYMYFIMPQPDGGFAVVTSKEVCDGWKIKYSPFSVGHFIFGVRFLASFDKVYGGSGRKSIHLNLQYVKTLGEAYKAVSEIYGVPLVKNVINGGFDGYAKTQIVGEADYVEITSPDGTTTKVAPNEKIAFEEYGFYEVTPFANGKRGLNSTVWNGGSFNELFGKCCDAVKKPYHTDDNLCEGGCFLWAMLINMRLGNHRKYDKIAREELDIIMAKKGEPVGRRTIAPYAQNGFAPYHIWNSDRVQEQFFGVSILLEAYKLYNEKEIFEHAVAALNELADNFIKDGMVDIGVDYTTVCCPMIPIVDMALLLKSMGDLRGERFENVAHQMAKFLYERGYNFPTEGEVSDLVDVEYEDGSISCTNMKNVKEYFDFASDVLKMHRAWTIYTPDAKMFGSSFRWWETIWEGDGEGPAICAGHAWTTWKAEALFYRGILAKDDEALLCSWNGFITNFSKARKDGAMYTCFEPDYIRGGGEYGIKKGLKQLFGEDLSVKYRVAHSYPNHIDSSLSRYAWARASYTWLSTAAVVSVNGEVLAINAYKNSDGNWQAKDFTTRFYVGKGIENVETRGVNII